MKRPAFLNISGQTDKLAVVATFMLALGMTMLAWRSADRAVEVEAQRQFEFRVTQMRDAIRGRMLDYAQVLRGSMGLFASSTDVSRAEWRAYVDSLKLENSYPGIQGLGYLARVPGGTLDAHVARVRAEGFPIYEVWPAGERPEYTPVVYVEPFTGRNLRAFGADLSHETLRRVAIERTRDTAEPAMSARVRLVQETDTDLQAGFLMFLAVYRNGLAIDLVPQRRQAVQGYIYAAFRVDNLMRGILGSVDDVRLQVFDGAGDSDLLYDSHHGRAPGAAMYAIESKLPVIDREWTVRASSLPAFDTAIDRSRPNITLVAGIVISLMLAALVWQLSTQRQRALRAARRMTVELRESREVLSLALDGSNLALFDCNLRTGAVHLSERWQAMLGYPERMTETTTAALESIVHPDDLPRLRSKLGDVLRGGIEFYDVEHRVRHREGYWVWIRSHARVVERDEENRALRITGTNADISERKQMDRLKDEFIATVNHELRTPLTALVGSLGLLQEESGTLPPTAATFLDMANKNADRLASLVNDILDIEKIEAGMVELKLEDVPLEPFLASALEINAGYAERYHTRYQLETPVPAATIQTDRDRLLQVLTNLLSNAAKFSPPGETVSVSAEPHGGRIRISVTDRGPGVPEEFRPRIFGKFAQADTPDAAKKGGTGLGLAISKALVEAMNGRIGYESRVGAGATFYIEVPVTKASRTAL
jgi:PAS domain S-box-containing protein